MHKTEIILFDWDGTLVDSFSFIEAAHNYVLETFEEPERPERWFETYFGKPRDFIYQDLYGSRGDEARSIFEDFVRKNHKALIKPMEGAQDMLESVHKLQKPMAVVSNKRSEFIHDEVAHLGWDKYFTAVIGAGDAQEDKPSAQPILEALRQSDISASENILYVGDTIVDMQTAKNANCPWILIAPVPTTSNWATEYPPVKIVGTCDEFSKYLLQSLK